MPKKTKVFLGISVGVLVLFVGIFSYLGGKGKLSSSAMMKPIPKTSPVYPTLALTLCVKTKDGARLCQNVKAYGQPDLQPNVGKELDTQGKEIVNTYTTWVADPATWPDGCRYNDKDVSSVGASPDVDSTGKAAIYCWDWNPQIQDYTTNLLAYVKIKNFVAPTPTPTPLPD